jgi:hypothetical protein
MKSNIIRSVVEIFSILVLFYTNLLMGQYLRTSSGVDGQSIWEKISNIVTPQNLIIGFLGATIGFIMVETVNQKLANSK